MNPRVEDLARRLKRRIGSTLSPHPNGAGDESNASYWSRHNVTQHRTFRTRDESLAYLAWRNAQYLFYDELIPMPDLDGAVVLDFGCGPGHDLVAITERARPARLIGMDVASTSLAEARARLALHGVAEPELVLLDEGSPHIPLDDASVDFFVSSGVLHHIPDVEPVLRELHRVLRPGGRGRVMVYNRDSIWVHLYVPFVRQLAERIDAELALDDAFRRSTDGPDCPHSVCYRPAGFVAQAAAAGFGATYLGAAISVHEMGLLPRRFAAIQDERLAAEHRDLLTSLTFDTHGRPLYKGHVAGIDGFFELTRA